MAPRDPVDTLRTKFWYEGLRLSLRVTTAYALERKIEPDGFKPKTADIAQSHRNKWSRYRRGVRTPNASTCAQADKVVARSSSDLNHVLWRALRKEPLATHADELLGQLSPKLLIKFEGLDLRHVGSGLRTLKKIEHQANLDALACLTILLRVNYEQGQHDRVWDFSRQILRMLLILGDIFDERKLAGELFDIYRERIFSLAKLGGEKLLLEEYEYCDAIAILRKCANRIISSTGLEPEWDEHVKCKRRILDGGLGIELMLFLKAPIGPDFDLGPPTAESLLRWKRYVQARDVFLR